MLTNEILSRIRTFSLGPFRSNKPFGKSFSRHVCRLQCCAVASGCNKCVCVYLILPHIYMEAHIQVNLYVMLPYIYLCIMYTRSGGVSVALHCTDSQSPTHIHTHTHTHTHTLTYRHTHRHTHNRALSFSLFSFESRVFIDN